jgi:hypothetical protein
LHIRLIQDRLAEFARLLHHRCFFDSRLHIEFDYDPRDTSANLGTPGASIHHTLRKNANRAFLQGVIFLSPSFLTLVCLCQVRFRTPDFGIELGTCSQPGYGTNLSS